ncbi:nuclear transport factor 2 family protein [Oerskovia jenensis]|uniref:Ketosteroid isomerase-like protein n=1 Tax=Oerskovia jenensis TaxID=162169 RepID=A0ABS2L9T8_9CELL|nr:nuclear transport factor 2 family protein [Oerskovia jenensis]MBM7477201.1 ketosteroid isomerase-like protein [Oerskovia jenensis]
MSLLAAEHALQAAQRAGDVDALDALLHPRCVGVGPDGSVFSKDDDLESHRSGALRITRLEEESLDVREDAVCGVTRLVAAVEAIQGGAAVSARLVYTRLWARTDERWRVLAATLAPAADPSSADVGGTV